MPFRCTILLADTEATDEHFCEKYFDGDQEAFLGACALSCIATDDYLEPLREAHNSGDFVSTSFFKAFGNERFREVEAAYQDVLSREYQNYRLPRVDEDIKGRTKLYGKLYGINSHDYPFLVRRTIRTMAQYLTLGRMIAPDEQSCIVVHDTVNAAVFQSTNKHLLPGDIAGTLPISPVIKQDLRVYQ